MGIHQVDQFEARLHEAGDFLRFNFGVSLILEHLLVFRNDRGPRRLDGLDGRRLGLCFLRGLLLHRLHEANR